MKNTRYYGLVLLLGWTINLVAQTYHAFPANGTWYYKRYADMGQPLPGFEVFKTLGDTSLAGHLYHKVFLNSVYYGVVRDSSQRVYFRAREGSLEHQLYDFNKLVGDTIAVPYPLEGQGFSCDTFIVTDISQLPTLDGSRRALTLGGCNGLFWIEEIGNTWWFSTPPYLGSVSGGSYLTCFFDSTQLIYSIDGNFCSVGTSAGGNVPDHFQVFPNPTSGILLVPALPDAPYRISIVDVTGKCWLTYTDVEASIDISALPDGIYWLKLQTSSQIKVVKVVKRDSS